MKEFKGTKGFHHVMYSAGVCLGVGVRLDDSYYQYTCNSILPDSDVLYEIEKAEIIANMQLYSAAPDLLQALQEIHSTYGKLWSRRESELVTNAINKALDL